MVIRLTEKEQDRIRNLTGRQKKTGAQVAAILARERRARGQEPTDDSSIYRFLRGETHKLGVKEKRGRPKAICPDDIRALQQARRRLVKAADSEEQVTWADVVAEADLEDPPCLRVIQDALRDKGVRFRPPRRKIQLNDKDVKKRFAVSKVWLKRRSSFWSKKVHGYYDNKKFPTPLTPAQRKRMKQTMVTGHLRTPSEGVQQGFTKPRQAHSWLGIPSVTISAVVAKDRIIMWTVQTGHWNGQKAADTYKGPMLKSLRRVWGPRRQYNIVEDGDRTGNQSNKGIAAKKAAHIKSTMLPPRTPSWMPLDYAIWQRIMEKVLETAPCDKETKAAYLTRLKKCAMSLPKTWVEMQIGRMRENIKGVKDARGYHAKKD